jgi:DNA-binding transcriptional ArsR family regulator
MAVYFKALGDPTRLRIFEFLVKQCCPVAVGEEGAVRPAQGPTVGEVCCFITGLDQSSRISFHLKELRVAGLILMEKQGKFSICSPNLEALQKLAEFFQTSAQACCCS